MLNNTENEIVKQRAANFEKPLKVLIIEDNQVDRKMLESLLSEESAMVSFMKSTDSLKSAVNLLDQYEFDTVVLDLNLPDSKGRETLLKLSEKYPAIAIVVNTGAYEDDLGIQTLGWGAQDFLVKGKYTAYGLNKSLHFAKERKRLELELTKAYEKLKETQAQLIQAEKLKVVGGLAAGVAHEVKNPLATILYGVTYLKEQLKNPDEKIAMVIDNIRDATNRSNVIITDLLDYSSLTRLNKEVEDLNVVVKKALSLISHQIKKDAIEIIEDFDPKLPKIKLDRYKIEQVIINLLLNAIHAMPQGGKIKIRTGSAVVSDDLKEIPQLHKKDFKKGEQVVFVEVEDTGEGIPEGKNDKIFDPFFTSRRAKGGVGLGLSVSRNIIEIHNGAIKVENNKKQGAVATVMLKV